MGPHQFGTRTTHGAAQRQEPWQHGGAGVMWHHAIRQGSRRFTALLCLVCCLCCCSCQGVVTRSAIRTFGTVMDAGQPAYARETDLTLAEPALATTVKLLEALLESDPNNPTLLLQAAQGLCSYTYAFVESQIETARGHNPHQAAWQTERAQRLYRRGLQYSWQRLRLFNPAWDQGPQLELAVLTPLLRQLDATAVPALFWTAFCWGNLLNLSRTELETVAALPRLAALVTRLVELDDTYFYGAPHLLQAVQYASRSSLLGGDPARAQQHFRQAYAISQGRLLLIPLLEAQYYAVQVQDRALFSTRLEEILQAPETLFPEQGFLNTVARQRAALLLRRIDELFP